MSFILDALRKSENSRLRQDHPAIFAARTTAARSRLPTWALVLVVLLAMNLLLVAYVLWRDSDAPAPATPQTAASPSVSTPASVPTPVQTGSPPQAGAIAAMPIRSAAGPAVDGGAPPRTERPARVERAVRVEQPLRTAQPARSATRDDLLARGTNVPPAELNMHVYDADPRLRFVLLNGQRLREGEASLEGLAVERITPEGVVLRFGAASFAVNLQ